MAWEESRKQFNGFSGFLEARSRMNIGDLSDIFIIRTLSSTGVSVTIRAIYTHSYTRENTRTHTLRMIIPYFRDRDRGWRVKGRADMEDENARVRIRRFPIPSEDVHPLWSL